MTNYSFFIIIDTNDPSSFHIEMTKMNYRLRFSALKSNHIRKYGGNVPMHIHIPMTHSMCECNDVNLQCSLPGYHNILRSNYTFYLLDKLDLTPEQATTHKLNLIERYKRQQHINESQGKFIISF